MIPLCRSFCNVTSIIIEIKYKKLTLFLFEESLGNTDKKNILESMDDAANNQWGCNWRIPTKDEFEELRTNCTWVWTAANGVNGYKNTSNNKEYTGIF